MLIAAWKGQEKMVKFLLKNGALVNQMSQQGLTPLCRGICGGSIEVMHTLIAAGADVNQVEKGITPLMFAVMHCDLELIEKILKAGAHATINALDEDGHNVLWYANIQLDFDENPEKFEIISLLETHGAQYL